MPKKHLRDDADIGGLAEELAGRWQQGDGVEPWLRSLESELSRKVRDERWSWESIARALNIAGILYQTGRPWTGTSLLQKITSIRYEGRRHARRKADDLPQSMPVPILPALPAPSAAPPALAVHTPAIETADVGVDDEPEFRPAKLASHWSGTKIVRQEVKPPETKPSPAQPPTGDADEVIARLLGKK
jgi:hypothetical protein